MPTEPWLEGLPPIRRAGPPFNLTNADCILRSSDNLEIRVHKVILGIASDVFNSMFAFPPSSSADDSDASSFTLALPSSNPNYQETKEGLPVISLSEPSHVLLPLFRLCYPVRTPVFAKTSFSELTALYDAVDKYAMEDIAQPILDALIQAVPRNAMAAFAFGCRHGLRNLTITAAKETLKFSSDNLPYSPELDRITGSQLHRLYDYHRQCRAAAGELAKKKWGWIPALSSIPLAAASNACSACRMEVTQSKETINGMVRRTSDNKWVFYCPRWWWDYMGKAESALKKTPRGATVRSAELLGTALGKAVECQKEACRGSSQAMIRFSALFAEEVEKAIDAVRLHWFAIGGKAPCSALITFLSVFLR